MTSLLPPAPPKLLNTIFCNCSKNCGGNCGCKKLGYPINMTTMGKDSHIVDIDISILDVLSFCITENEENS